MNNGFTYVGYSTNTSLARKKRQWKQYDIDLIQTDLLNHFNTKMGQRIGRPTFGCRIWEYLMEQRSEFILQDIKDEVERICRADARIVFRKVQLFEIDHGVVAVATVTTDLSIDPVELRFSFDQRQEVATRG